LKRCRLLVFLVVAAVVFSFAAHNAVATPKVTNPGLSSLVEVFADEVLSAQTSKSFRFVDPEPLYLALSSDTGAYFILDLRPAATYATGHIDADFDLNIAIFDVAHPENLDLLPTDIPIVVICGSGQSASFVTGILQMLGYDAYSLAGGMTAWTAAGYPLVPTTSD
jgi:rhodanese-related sulfurtransferase